MAQGGQVPCAQGEQEQAPCDRLAFHHLDTSPQRGGGVQGVAVGVTELAGCRDAEDAIKLGQEGREAGAVLVLGGGDTVTLPGGDGLLGDNDAVMGAHTVGHAVHGGEGHAGGGAVGYVHAGEGFGHNGDHRLTLPIRRNFS